MAKTMLGARMAMGSPGYPPANWRDIMDRLSFENGRRPILFRPRAAYGGGSTAIVARAHGSCGRYVVRAIIGVGGGTHLDGADFMRVSVPAPNR